MNDNSEQNQTQQNKAQLKANINNQRRFFLPRTSHFQPVISDRQTEDFSAFHATVATSSGHRAGSGVQNPGVNNTHSQGWGSRRKIETETETETRKVRDRDRDRSRWRARPGQNTYIKFCMGRNAKS